MDWLERRALLERLKIPELFKITARQINELSMARRFAKSREKDLERESNQHVRDAYGKLSMKSLHHCITVEAAQEAQVTRRGYNDIVMRFENNNRRLRQRHTGEIQKMRVIRTLLARERAFVRDRGMLLFCYSIRNGILFSWKVVH